MSRFGRQRPFKESKLSKAKNNLGKKDSPNEQLGVDLTKDYRVIGVFRRNGFEDLYESVMREFCVEVFVVEDKLVGLLPTVYLKYIDENYNLSSFPDFLGYDLDFGISF